MTGGHRTKQVFKTPSRTDAWRCRDGLKYPLNIYTTSGIITFYSYEEHHEYIAQLFPRPPKINKTK